MKIAMDCKQALKEGGHPIPDATRFALRKEAADGRMSVGLRATEVKIL